MNAQPYVFLGTVGHGPWRSGDGGQNFEMKFGDVMYVQCDVRSLAYHPHDPKVLFAGTNEGFYRSTDSGENWTRFDSEMNDMQIWSLAVLPSDPNTLFAGTRPATVFRSTNGGETWERLNTNFQQHCPAIIYNRVTTMYADPDVPDRIWAGVEIDGIWRSDDRGETWTQYCEGLSSMDIHGLEIVSGNGSGRRLIASTNNDLNISTDEGETWQPQNVSSLFPDGYCRGIKQIQPGVLFLGTGDGPPGSRGIPWRSDDGGQTWKRMELPIMPNSTVWDFAVHPSNPNLVYSYTNFGNLFRTTDGGDHWELLPQGFGELRAMIWVPA